MNAWSLAPHVQHLRPNTRRLLFGSLLVTCNSSLPLVLLHGKELRKLIRGISEGAGQGQLS